MIPDVPPLPDPNAFRWPEGKRAGLSLTFDDGRTSQVDIGAKILDSYNVRGTFYVLPDAIEQRLDAWKQAVLRGHEIGNHTCTHPCGGASWCRTKQRWEQKNSLENFTLERMCGEIDGANEKIKEMLGVTPETFAYPCGHPWVGRGRERRSYAHLVAERFLVGRGIVLGQAIPGYVDLADIPVVGSDRMSVEYFRSEIEKAIQEGNWLILVAHEIADENVRLITQAKVLDDICCYASNPASGVWVDTVKAIGTYIRKQREVA